LDKQSNNSAPSDELLLVVGAEPMVVAADKLDTIRDECRRLRDDELEIQDLTDQLTRATARRTARLRETLPELMDQAGVPGMNLAAEGNKPAFQISVEPFYSASIAADWPEEKRRAAFDWLDQNGCGDLVKTAVVARFGREDRSRALDVVAAMRAAGVADLEVGEAVHAATLTKWLRERHQASLLLPALDVVGGFIGRVAKIRPVKVKK
jgi:hypothetical protein